MTTLQPFDEEFLKAFQDCTLLPAEWTHRAHVRVAWMLASEFDLHVAIDQMRTHVQAYNKATQTPDAIDRGYHETITQAFLQLVYAANQRTGPHATSDDFWSAHPEFQSKYVLETYYSPQRLMTFDAKQRFVEPDLAPLPVIPTPAGSSAPEHNDTGEANEYSVVEELSERQIGELHSLIQQQWWGGQRSLEDVQLMVKNTSLMFGLVEKISGRLVGFCRVLTDFAFRATVYDVMVVDELQGTGLGRRLMDVLCEDPRLRRVSMIYLCCEPEMFTFYERWGFAEYDGRTHWMMKVQRAE